MSDREGLRPVQTTVQAAEAHRQTQAGLRQKLAEQGAEGYTPAPASTELADAHAGVSPASQARTRIAEKLAALGPHDHDGRPVEAAPEVTRVDLPGSTAQG